MRVPSLTTRPAGLLDLGEVGRLHHRHLAWHADLDPDYAPPSPEVLTQWHAERLGDRLQALVVAVVEDRVVGFVTARVEPPPATVRWRWFQIATPERPGTIGDLFVDESHRRQGVGAALAVAARDWLQRAGATRIELTVLAGNPAGLAFWQAVGFAPHRLILREALERTRGAGG